MEKNSEKLTDINQIGEFGLIDLITKDFEIVNDSTELSIGDDAAILNYKNQMLDMIQVLCLIKYM